MKRCFYVLFAFVLAFSLLPFSTPITVMAVIPGEDAVSAEQKVYCDATLEDDFADDRVLVVLSCAASVSFVDYGVAHFAAIGCKSVRNLTPTATELVEAELKCGEIPEKYTVTSNAIIFDDFFDLNTANFHKILCLELTEPGKENVLSAVKLLEQRDDVICACPDYIFSVCGTEPMGEYCEDAGQWAINKIQLPQAWDMETGDASVYVGVIDSGIDGDHPDLKNRVSVSMSRDFLNGSSVAVSRVTDPLGHGTHVAGIIAAQGNNTTGISGVSWYTTLVSLRVIDENDVAYCSALVSAINYATSCGIPILNFSGGWTDVYESMITVLNAALTSYNGLFICAAGNQGNDIDSSPVAPASFVGDRIITVGASTSGDRKLDNSNYSKTRVDLFAPGENILSCFPEDICENNPDACETVYNSDHKEDGYHYIGGTSMASPYVSGVAALILAMHPSLSAAEIKDWIMDGVDIVKDADGKSVFGAYCVSGGRLNAYNAVNNHVYDSYTSLNASKHNCVCECGAVRLEVHTWKTVTRVEIGGGSVTVTYCTKCNYEK